MKFVIYLEHKEDPFITHVIGPYNTVSEAMEDITRTIQKELLGDILEYSLRIYKLITPDCNKTTSSLR